MTRVLLLARELDVGGSERQMTEIARFLDRRLFEPRVGCFLPAGLRGEELRAAGIPVVQFPVHSFKSWPAMAGARQFIRYIRKENIRLVHAFDYPLNVFAVPLARAFTSATAVASQRSHRELVPRGYRQPLRFADRMAHAVVVNCNYLRRHLTDEENVPARKVYICPNGIDLSVFERRGLPRPPALAGSTLVIGAICALRPEKGLLTLIEAFAQVQALQPGIQLAIVGSGSMLAQLEGAASRLGVREACHFEPATRQVPLWLAGMDIFVLPSLSEALSNALMEAMACGCPSIASNVGGNPELVRHGETGLLFQKGDAAGLAAALRQLIENPGLRNRLARQGEHFVRENFSIQSAARHMGDIYSELLGHGWSDTGRGLCERRSRPAVTFGRTQVR